MFGLEDGPLTWSPPLESPTEEKKDMILVIKDETFFPWHATDGMNPRLLLSAALFSKTASKHANGSWIGKRVCSCVCRRQAETIDNMWDLI